jgi:hypothetical protein
MNPDGRRKRGLHERVGEVKGASGPMKNGCKNKEKTNRGPGHNRSESFKSVLLKVASAAEPGLAFLDLTIRSSLDTKYPSAWNYLRLGVRDVDFIP